MSTSEGSSGRGPLSALSVCLDFFVTVKNVFDRLSIADRSRGILPGAARLVRTGLKFSS